MKDDRIYLRHILECTDRILSYTGGGRGSFFVDAMVQDAVLRNLEVIGEAAKNVSEELRRAHPSIPWKRVSGLRDVLIHHYFGVDLETVWRVVEDHLPDLKRQLQELLRALGES